MIEPITIYINSDHQIRYRIMHLDSKTGNVVPVPPNHINRVQLYLRGIRTYCIDTDEATHPITLMDDAKIIGLRLGRIEELRTGQYKGWLTLFDAESPNGIPWGQGGLHKDEPTFIAKAIYWPMCG